MQRVQDRSSGSPARSTSMFVAAPSDGSRLNASSVHFTPGASTAWHTHPNGQTIYVTEGVGLAQRRGGSIEVIRPGDRVFFFIPPTGFIASGTLLSGPEKGTRPDWDEPWASRYIAKIGDLRLLRTPLSLEEIRQKTVGWGWPTYPRSYTTVPDAFVAILEEIIAPREPSV